MTPWIAYAKEILDNDLINEFYQGKVNHINHIYFLTRCILYIAYIQHNNAHINLENINYRKEIKGITNICPQILVAKSLITNAKFLSAYEINNRNNKQKQIFLNILKVFYLTPFS